MWNCTEKVNLMMVIWVCPPTHTHRHQCHWCSKFKFSMSSKNYVFMVCMNVFVCFLFCFFLLIIFLITVNNLFREKKMTNKFLLMVGDGGATFRKKWMKFNQSIDGCIWWIGGSVQPTKPSNRYWIISSLWL